LLLAVKSNLVRNCAALSLPLLLVHRALVRVPSSPPPVVRCFLSRTMSLAALSACLTSRASCRSSVAACHFSAVPLCLSRQFGPGRLLPRCVSSSAKLILISVPISGAGQSGANCVASADKPAMDDLRSHTERGW